MRVRPRVRTRTADPPRFSISGGACRRHCGMTIMKTKRVLITGHEGYIGSVMTPLFLAAGYDVTGLDVGYFRQCTLRADRVAVPLMDMDLRNIGVSDLYGFNGVIPLTA